VTGSKTLLKEAELVEAEIERVPGRFKPKTTPIPETTMMRRCNTI
jgi:hypothetical protein